MKFITLNVMIIYKNLLSKKKLSTSIISKKCAIDDKQRDYHSNV